MKNTVFANLVVTLLLSPASPAAELLVPSQYPTIQSSIDAAVDGDTVIIAPGTYTGEGNRDISFEGKAITVQSEDPTDPKTVAATIIDCNADTMNRHRGFIFSSGEGPYSVLTGVSIVRGCAALFQSDGGAIYCASSSPTISRCVLFNNHAELGGGLGCFNSNAVISDCVITCNSIEGCGGGGAAISCFFGAVTIKGCKITDNISQHWAGSAIMCMRGGPRVEDCLISSKTEAHLDGLILFDEGLIKRCTLISQTEAGIVIDGPNCIIEDCTIIHGLCGISSYGNSNAVVSRCTISPSSNSALNGVRVQDTGNLSISDSNISGHSAEGIWFEGNDLTIRNCTITHNGGGISTVREVATTQCLVAGNENTEGVGVGIYARGNITIERSRIVGNTGVGADIVGTIRDSLIAGNCAGIVMWDLPKSGSNVITNCTVVTNGQKCSEHSFGIRCYKSRISNCIVWGNGTLTGEPANQIRIDRRYSTVQYSCVEGGFPGDGNIDTEPQFVMPGYWDANGTPDDANDDFWVDGDYRLRGDSPCIDTGEPNFIAGPNETDIDGNPRVTDGDGDGNSIVDMGAYEYIPPIEARVCIMPNVLNLKSNGRWIICSIKLPMGYSVEDIDSNSVFLQEEIAAQRVLAIGQAALVFFDRQAVEAILQSGEVELLITGQLISGREFEGSDTIKVISGPKGPGKRGGQK